MLICQQTSICIIDIFMYCSFLDIFLILYWNFNYFIYIQFLILTLKQCFVFVECPDLHFLCELIQMDPSKGNVAFGSGLHGWGFNLRQFANLYAAKFGIKEEKLMRRLWGENFYNPKTRQWTTEMTEGSVRGFNQFVLEPLIKVNIFAVCFHSFFARQLLLSFVLSLEVATFTCSILGHCCFNLIYPQKLLH